MVISYIYVEGEQREKTMRTNGKNGTPATFEDTVQHLSIISCNLTEVQRGWISNPNLQRINQNSKILSDFSEVTKLVSKRA